MRIKKYIVSDMKEAMEKIGKELGKEAIITETKKVRAPGIMGYFKPSKLYVKAVLKDEKEIETKEKLRESKSNGFLKSLNSEKCTLSNEAEKEAATTVLNEPKKEELENLSNSIKNMESMLDKVIKSNNLTNSQSLELNEIKEYLANLDISDDYLEELSEVYIENKDIEAVKNKIMEDINIFNSNIKGKVALVGPTGVGKTTTIAKLAGRLALTEKKSVGLITIDTYRIGAVEQLRAYAEIMRIPFKVVVTTKEMEDAIEEMKDRDVILIDTTGRSSKNSMQISELRSYIDKAEPDHTLLVLSSTTKNRDIKTILNGYSSLNYDKTIITKLDETMTYGSIYTILKETKKPIAFVTIGQLVPNDIKIPTKDDIGKLIVGEDAVC